MASIVSDLDLSRRVQCFTCRQVIFLCQCAGNQAATGRECQFMIEEEDLPDQSVESSIQDNIHFWGRLVRLGKATQQFDMNEILNRVFVAENLYNTLKDENVRQQFYSFSHAYTQHPHFLEVVVRAFPGLTLPELQLLGKEGLDSIFSGRWYEICRAQIGLIMNSLQLCGPNPNDPNSLPLKKVVNSLMLIDAVLDSLSEKRGFSIVDPYRLAAMRSLTVYKLKPKEEANAPNTAQKETNNTDPGDDDDLPALVDESGDA
eukprot:gene6436-6933_t